MDNQQHAMSSPRKFRVWDGEEMHSPEALFVLDSRGNVWPYGVEHGSPTRDDLVPLFYTGLTDSEGTEIYESDIVRWEYNAPWGNGPMVRREKVTFRDGCWRVGGGLGAQVLGKALKLSVSMVVVGNEHETPELLEQEPA